MTISELRQKHPEETKFWQDDQCMQYCRTLESFVNIFIDYAEKQLHKEKIDTYANYLR